jgi:4-amino-4-deoxy-L-arabinose transferase-like glycosyltransferase
MEHQTPAAGIGVAATGRKWSPIVKRTRPLPPAGQPVPPSSPFTFSLMATGVVVLGLLARLWLYWRVPAINSDGFLYIQQAKALHFGRMDQILDCFTYLSPYPIAVSAAYRFLGDWLQAAQFVNIFFSTLSIVALYWLLRRFFRNTLASTTLLIYALLPAYVLVGRDALRDPLFWIFGLTGVYLFVLNLEARRPVLLLMAGLFLELAAWARVEGLLYVVVTAVFIPFSGSRKRTLDVGLFLSPFLLVMAVSVVLAHLKGIDLISFLNPQRILDYPRGLVSQYHSLRDLLASLHPPDMSVISPYFFSRIRSLLWTIPIISLVLLTFETLLYVFCLFLIAGFVSWARRVRTDLRLAYLAALCLPALILLYFFTLDMWHSASRLLAIFLLPAFVFMGAGVKAFSTWLSEHFQWQQVSGYALVWGLVLLTFVPKIGRADFDHDKLIFPAIGRCIAQREANGRTVTICGSFKEIDTIHFYANLDTQAAPCFDPKAVLRGGDTATLEAMLCSGYDYFVWDAAGWPGMDPDQIRLKPPFRLCKIKTWESRKYGRLILFEVLK